jgi:hypothetical protein
MLYSRPQIVYSAQGFNLVAKTLYLVSEVFDLKPTSGLYLKNSARLFNFLTPPTFSVVSSAHGPRKLSPGFTLGNAIFIASGPEGAPGSPGRDVEC